MAQEIITPGTPEWFAARKVRITSTDVPAILGVAVSEGRYKESTPYRIAARIKGLLPEEEDQDSDLFFYGTASEQLNSKLYLRAVKKDAQQERSVIVSPGLCLHPEFNWLASTPDGMVYREEGFARPDSDSKTPFADTVKRMCGVWEAKAPIWGRAKWSEGVPLAYKVQVYISMAILGLPWASVSALRPPTVDWADIECDERAKQNMLEVLRAWWDRYIVGDDMPGVEAGDSPLLRDLHRPEPKKTIFLPLALSDAAEELAGKLATIKALEEEAEKLKAELQQHMLAEKAEIALTADGTSGWKFTKQIQQIKAKPATEAGTREVVKFERYTPKEFK